MSKIYPRNIKKQILMMLDVFNTLQYPTKDANGTITDVIVPIKYATSERLLAFINLLDDDRDKYKVSLPILSLDLTSLDPNEEENQNSENTTVSCDETEAVGQPAYYDATWDLSIWARQDKESQLWDIAEQIMSKWNTTIHYPFVAYKFTDNSEIKYNVPIKLQSTSKNFNKVDISSEDETEIKFVITFLTTIRIYKGLNPNAKLPIIKTIDIDFENENEARLQNFLIEEDEEGNVTVTKEI